MKNRFKLALLLVLVLPGLVLARGGRPSQYPNGFRNGVAIRGVPILNTYPSNVFYVHSGTGSDGNNGKTIDKPFATIDAAINACTAGKGDIVLVKPGHVESITGDSGIDADVTGITIQGMGTGEFRPVITFTTVTTADFKIAAANVTVSGLVFKCDIASQEMMIEVTGDDSVIENCEFREGTATGLNFITVGVEDNDSDRARIYNNRFHMPTAGNGDSAISVSFDMLKVEIANNLIYGDFDLAGIDVPAGGNAQVDALIENNVITNLLTGQHAIQIVGTGSTGKIINCQIETDTQSASLDAGGMEVYNVLYHDGTDQTSAVVALPTADGSENILGADNSNNTFASTNVVDNGDGSIIEREEHIQADTDKIDGATLATPTANSLAAFVASGGTGLGTDLADSESLVDILYATNGIVTYPAAELPANGVSIAEVLREVHDQSEKSVSGSTAVMVNGDTLFTIANGPIEILSLTSVCITVNDGTASTLQYSANPTVGTATTFSGASASLSTAAAGSGVILNMTATSTAPDLIDPLVGLTGVHTRGIVVNEGVITIVVGVGSTTGTWKHYLRYRPLGRGVTVSGT